MPSEEGDQAAFPDIIHPSPSHPAVERSADAASSSVIPPDRSEHSDRSEAHSSGTHSETRSTVSEAIEPAEPAIEPNSEFSSRSVAETLVTEAPVTEAPVTETPVAETPVAETLVAETPVAETPITETTREPVTEPIPTPSTAENWEAGASAADLLGGPLSIHDRLNPATAQPVPSSYPSNPAPSADSLTDTAAPEPPADRSVEPHSPDQSGRPEASEDGFYSISWMILPELDALIWQRLQPSRTLANRPTDPTIASPRSSNSTAANAPTRTPAPIPAPVPEPAASVAIESEEIESEEIESEEIEPEAIEPVAIESEVPESPVRESSIESEIESEIEPGIESEAEPESESEVESEIEPDIDRRDSIRLDLPTSDTAEQTPPEPPEEPESAESPLRAVPGEPTSGEVLVIPTEPTTDPAINPADPAAPATPAAPNAPPVPIDPLQQGEVLEVTADRQEIDEQRQVFRADGNVVARFRQAVLSADRVRVNLPNRVAVAEGNALLTRGDQILGGDRFEYSFGLNQGEIQGARGQLFIPATERDFNTDPLTDFSNLGIDRPVTGRVSAAQPLQVTGGVPGLVFGVGDARTADGPGINRLRFEADQADFDGGNLVARNVRITNDPFSPPELELRSSYVTYTRLSPFTAEIRARNPRLVFDQGFSLPLLVNRLVLDQRQRDSGLLNFGFDERDRDGFYIERTFNLYSSPQVAFSLTPQILVQRAIEDGGFPSADQFGLVANADFTFTPTTTARAVANFSSLDTTEIEDNLRASFRAQQLILGHTIAGEYSYRDRLFNGSLGFQDIQSSLGLVVSSPLYTLGDSLITLRYQAGVQYINAQTDQPDLYNFLDPDRDKSCIKQEDREISGNGCADLTRYQAAATLGRFFVLWTGTALPPTPTEGLRYTPTPLLPYLGIYLEARGVYSGYSNGDHQATLRGGISLLGQFGHFSRPFLDYTAFNVGYYNTLQDGESPFLFDRVADEEFIVLGLTQQIYGPFRAGVQFAYNVRSNDEIDTTYTLEYSRRTYSISATYSTGRESGALTFRLNDFNWTGDPGPFSGLGSRTVDGGVIQNSL